jgi:putative heme degradation protein
MVCSTFFVSFWLAAFCWQNHYYVMLLLSQGCRIFQSLQVFRVYFSDVEKALLWQASRRLFLCSRKILCRFQLKEVGSHVSFRTTQSKSPDVHQSATYIRTRWQYRQDAHQCLVMCVLKSTRKRTNRLQYSVCKCEVEFTGKWSNVGVLFNQPHFNLVPKVGGLIQE